MIPQAPILYIKAEITLRYEQSDKVHNLLHMQAIIEENLALAKLYPEADERLAYIIAVYHDIGLCRDRATHHLVSGEIMAEDANLLQWFGKEETEIMCEAIEDHWASTGHEPYSIYGEIAAEANRIIDPNATSRRAARYRPKQDPATDKAWHYQRFYDHLMEKYALDGYPELRFPHSENVWQSKELQAITVDEVRLRNIFHQMFEEGKR